MVMGMFCIIRRGHLERKQHQNRIAFADDAGRRKSTYATNTDEIIHEANLSVPSIDTSDKDKDDSLCSQGHIYMSTSTIA